MCCHVVTLSLGKEREWLGNEVPGESGCLQMSSCIPMTMSGNWEAGACTDGMLCQLVTFVFIFSPEFI